MLCSLFQLQFFLRLRLPYTCEYISLKLLRSGTGSMPGYKHSALFICLGNICRSPIAEAVFVNVITEAGLLDVWHVDSAALGPWHVGGSPDQRALNCLLKHGVRYQHTVRQIQKHDFNTFDYIFGMDEDNMKELKRKAPTNGKAKLYLLGEFDPNGQRIIRDPYYDDNDDGFETCYQQCVRSCTNFVQQMKSK